MKNSSKKLSDVKDLKLEDLYSTLEQRMHKNPGDFFIPNSKAEDFIYKVGSGESFVSLFSGGNGTSKTATCVNILSHIIWGPGQNKWFEEKGFDWEYPREGLSTQTGHRPEIKLPIYKDFPFVKSARIVSDPETVKDVIVPEMRKWFPAGRWKSYKRKKDYESYWVTDNGWTIDIMTYEQDPKEFESATKGVCYFDEPPPHLIYNAIVSRMRKGGIIYIGATPLKGSAWMYDHIVCYTKADKHRVTVFADIEDNCIKHGVRGYLEHENIAKMIKEYDQDEQEARAHGRFKHLTGLVFKNFNPEIHVIKPFVINQRDYVVIEALDPHDRNPDAVSWVARDRKGNWFYINELYGNYVTKELAERIKRKSENYRIIDRIADPALFKEDKHQVFAHQQTLAAKLSNQYGLSYNPASKTREDSDRAIRDALDYYKVGNEIIVAPELYIFDTCSRIIYELQHYQWDDWRGRLAENKSPREKPMDKDDHTIENLGRILIKDYSWFLPHPINPVRSSNGPTVESLDPYE